MVFKAEQETNGSKKLKERAASIYKPLPMDKVHFQHPDKCKTHLDVCTAGLYIRYCESLSYGTVKTFI